MGNYVCHHTSSAILLFLLNLSPNHHNTLRNRTPNNNRYKPQKAILPHPYPSTRYITGLKQREPKPRQSSEDIDSTVRTRPVHTIRLEEVRTRTLEYDRSANKRQSNTDVRNDPVGSVLCGPAVDEEADGNEQTRGDHEWDAEFGLADAVVGGFGTQVDLV
ncbi:hypothetical protein ASPFODRAFT_712546 [Aspergillus luchuensis CBS 106.47]|uniref:Uncharacterized protein n=1 Tax=Aspergillus luchuensis (strain CBS 106.47) TaxID=1137211 RepID=A0A1M3TMN0_ASPLC|nr:hypothetical protein ASPFODRAFT_712546 [Aspergillus luchuensis CBS 106.47]